MGKVSPSADWKKRFPNGTKHIELGPPQYRPAVTAKQLSQAPHFIAACDKLGVKPSVRQARDFRRRLGHFAHYIG